MTDSQHSAAQTAEEHAAWTLRGQQDAKDARYDPPSEPQARMAYDSGYAPNGEPTP